LGVVPGQIGLVQATEVLKLILKIGKPMIGIFFIYDALEAHFALMEVGKNPRCPLCSAKPEITSLMGYEQNIDRQDRACDGVI
jgi:adenylyltransferase/sulfurtransferase